MTRRTGRLWVFIGMLFLALATPVLAGGWAVVTLDKWPDSPRVGTALSLGFMVRQHGRTPIDSNPFGGEPLKPVLIATHKESSEKLELEARKEGPVGHFVVDVTFPTEGTWLLEIVPPPFAGTKFEPLTVLTAATKPATESEAGNTSSVTQPAASIAVQLPAWSAVRWTLITTILVVGLALTLLVRRASLRHRKTPALPEQSRV